MVKFSDNYIKWGVTAYLIGSAAFCVFVCIELVRTEPADALSGYILVAVVLTLNSFILVCGKDIIFRTVIMGKTGVQEKVFGKVKKEYAWDTVFACGICSRWVGSYWQYLVFFSDKPVTQKARYGREKEKRKGQGAFITIPLCTGALHAVYTYAPPEVIRLLEGEIYPGNMEALHRMLANYRKEPRCLLPDVDKGEPPLE